jgi:hypothetical protein
MCHLIVKDLQTNIGDRPDSLVFERERERREKRKEREGEKGDGKKNTSLRFGSLDFRLFQPQ